MSVSLSRSVRTSFVGIIALFAVTAIVVGGYFSIAKVMKTDVMAPYRVENTPFPFGEGVIIKNFDLKSYRGAELVAQAKVDEAKIRNDRSLIELNGVHDGVFYEDKTGNFHFSARKATYGTYSKAILADNDVRVWNKNVDLKAEGFTYDHTNKKVTVKGSVTGKLNGGEVTCEQVVIDLATSELRTAKVAWVGPLQIDGGAKTPWTVEADSSKTTNGVSTYTKAKGRDKETIVSCDSMSWERKTDVVTATGNVQYFGREANVTCAKAVIERKPGKATLTGKVAMLVKAKESAPKEEQIPPFTPKVPPSVQAERPQADTTPAQDAKTDQEEQVRSSKNLREYPIALSSERIEYWYRKGSRKAIVTGKPYGRQQLPDLAWRELYADKAEWDGEGDQLTLLTLGRERGVRMLNSLGDDMTAFKFVTSTKEGEDDYSAEKMVGTMMIDDNERPDKGTGTGTTGGGTGGTSGGPASVKGKIGK